ncbi:MAG: acid phosphatase type 7 [Actinomycetota bacterium]|jgi:hypothetical protein|nr:acid phosphatase type 7 [Actinomycetota bacterium]MDQ1667237.1 acid phosphatase type 7 [Actinomycetota bacterium]
MSGEMSRVHSVALRAAVSLLLLVVLGGCSGSTSSGQPSTTASGSAPASPSATGVEPGAASVTVVAAGDIGSSPDAGAGTAALVERLKPAVVLTLGDNAYPSGTRQDYAQKYDNTWGAFKDITRPIPGNHEYETRGASGYFDYFRAQVHDQPYYAWDAGTWRMYALNCEIDCGAGSGQAAWLKKDLVAHAGRPALAYVHRPRYTCSTKHDPFPELDAIWATLAGNGGRIMLAGHNHAYERFAPLDARGAPKADGLREFVVGTGGAEAYPVKEPCANREAADDQHHGLLSLDLKADSYTWEFLSEDGQVLDKGEQAT